MNNSLCVLDLVIFTKSIGIDAYYCQYLWKTSQLPGNRYIYSWTLISRFKHWYSEHYNSGGSPIRHIKMSRKSQLLFFNAFLFSHLASLDIEIIFSQLWNLKQAHKTWTEYDNFAFSFQWTKLPISFKAGSQDWGFVPPSKGLDGAPITLRTGDYNLDGFLDMVVVLQSTDSKG